jgi:hypothetical protein
MLLVVKVFMIIWQAIVAEVGDVAIETNPVYNEDEE